VRAHFAAPQLGCERTRALADAYAAPKRTRAERSPSPAPADEAAPPLAAAAAAAASLRASPPPRPRLWVPPDQAVALERAAVASVPQPPPEARTAVCDICGGEGAWASGVGTGAQAKQPLCAACRVWRRFPRVGAHANLTPQQLPSKQQAPQAGK
jgi:hypothetical protein